MAAGLGDAIGRVVTLQELFADGGDVAVNPDLTIRLSKLQAVLSGEVVRLGAGSATAGRRVGVPHLATHPDRLVVGCLQRVTSREGVFRLPGG